MKRHLTTAGSVLLVFLTPPLHAQQAHPNVATGTRSESLYVDSGGDQVNLFNGNLSYTIPIGEAIPVGPILRIAPRLVYNSQINKVWQVQFRVPGQGEQVSISEATTGDRVLGAGWQLHFGRLIAPPAGYTGQGTVEPTANAKPLPSAADLPEPPSPGMWPTGFAYLSPEGAVHVFHDRKIESETPLPGPPQTAADWRCAKAPERAAGEYCYGYTHDGSFLRFDPIDPDHGGQPVVYFPDGTRQVMGFAGGRVVKEDDPAFTWASAVDYLRFSSEAISRTLASGAVEQGPWNTTAILDPWGNSISVAYYGQPSTCRTATACAPAHPLLAQEANRRDAIVWSAWDTALPTHRYVELTTTLRTESRDPQPVVTSISTLSSAPESGGAPVRAPWLLDTALSARGFFRLSLLTLPTGQSLQPDYEDDAVLTQDVLTSMGLPTGGALEWDYDQLVFYQQQRQECPGECANVFGVSHGMGVVARRTIRQVVPVGGSARQEAAETRYIRSYDHDPDSSGSKIPCSIDSVSDCQMRVDVWKPAAASGNRAVTRSRFHESNGVFKGALYGRPMTTDDFEVTAGTNPGRDALDGLSPFRSTAFAYSADGPSLDDQPNAPGYEHNTRNLTTMTTWASGRSTSEHHSSWDPLTGHWSRTVTTETIPPAGPVELRAVTETWLETPPSSPNVWNLSLLFSRSVSRLGDPLLDPSGANLDTTETFEYDSTGFRTARQILGVETQGTRTLRHEWTKGVQATGPCLAGGVNSASCSNLGFPTQQTDRLTGTFMNETVDSTYTSWYYYRYGALAASRDNARFYSVDRDLAYTGRPLGERGPNGRTSLYDTDPQLTTVNRYDLLGRLISVQPPGEGREDLSYTNQSVLRVKTDMSNTEVSRRESFFDQLGRPSAERVLMPGNAWSCRLTAYDLAGRRVGQTEWWKSGDPQAGSLCDHLLDVQPVLSADANPVLNPPGTTWSGFDALGRPTRTRLADGSLVTNAYEGWWHQQTDRKVNSETLSRTIVARDVLGQVVAVTEPAATKGDGTPMNPAETTIYRYDHEGRLIAVRKPGSDSNAGATLTQTRTLRYDDFGWLIYQITPEQPMTVLSRDARGNPTKTMDALIYVTKTYDGAGRLLTSSKVNDAPKWILNGSPSTAYEHHTYDAITGLDTGRSNGKLVSSIRMNHAVTNEGFNDFGWFGVLDMFHFGGPGGRLSFRQHGGFQFGSAVTPPPATSAQGLEASRKKTPSQIAFDRYFASGGRTVKSYAEAVALMSPSEAAASARLLAGADNPSGMARWQYQYDSAGRPSHVVYPRRDEGYPTEVTYTYDNGFLTGVVAEIRDPFAATTVDTVTGSLSYSPAGSVTSTTVHSSSGGTNVFTLATPRDVSGISRPGSWSLSAPGGTESRTFSYDPSGNVRSIGADTYFYDSRGRLTKDWLSVRGTDELREYDGFGNLTRVGSTPISVDRATNRLNAPGTIWNTRGELIYDTTDDRTLGRDYYPDGALTAEHSHPAGNPFGTPPAISAWLVDYNGDNALTFYGDGLYCNTELFVASLRGEDRSVLTDYKADVVDSNCDCGVNVCSYAEKFRKDYIQIGPWARVTYARGEGTAFWALDHLGTSRTRLNKFGDVVSSLRLDSFGQELSATPGERHRFTGHERNHVSVLDGPQFPISDFMHARTYVPMLGRFTRPDPSTKVRLFNPQSFNRYSYALNNPVLYVDPDGRDVSVASIVDLGDRLRLLRALEDKTGLKLSISSGKIVVVGASLNAHGLIQGSGIARSNLLGAIGADRTISVRTSSATLLGRASGDKTIDLNFSNIAKIDASQSDSRSFDLGMIFLHELFHTNGPQNDDPKEPVRKKMPTIKGPAVDHMNTIREEMGWPTRLQYDPLRAADGRWFLPFSDGRVYLPGKID